MKEREKKYTGLFQECVICRKKSPLSELGQPKNQDSWKTVFDTARIHCCEHIISLEDADIASLYYHHDCRRNYTHFKTLNHVLSQKQGESCPPTANIENNLRRSARNSAPSTESVCIFCQKLSKYQKGKRTREELSQKEKKMDIFNT